MYIPESDKDAKQNGKRHWNCNRAANLAVVLIFVLVIFVTIFLSSFQLAVKLADIARGTAGTQSKITDIISRIRPFLGNPIRGFPYTEQLIGWSNRVFINQLQLTLVNDVVIGKDGWLFVNDSRSIDDYKGILRYTDQELTVFSATLESRKNWLTKQGIPLLLVIAPNKESVYPEFLPDGIKKVNPGSRLDQLINHLQLNSDVDILDLRQPFKRMKDQYQLYYKTDSHWNSYGSYFAYSEIMNRLKNYFPGVEAYPISDYAEKVDNFTAAGDLAKLIMMEDSYKEKRFGLEIIEDKASAQNIKIPSAIIYCDSFYGGIGPFLSQHFDRIAASQHDAVNGSFDQGIIAMEKPDIVIYIMVERFVPRYFLKGYDFFKLN